MTAPLQYTGREARNNSTRLGLEVGPEGLQRLRNGKSIFVA